MKVIGKTLILEDTDICKASKDKSLGELLLEDFKVSVNSIYDYDTILLQYGRMIVFFKFRNDKNIMKMGEVFANISDLKLIDREYV